MKKNNGNGLLATGGFSVSGVTFYMRQGRVVRRPSTSVERRSNTITQFVQRQKMRHTIALWHTLKFCNPMFTEHRTAYLNFASLANRMQPVFVPQAGGKNVASFLMPGIPVSDGTLTPVEQRLDEVDGAMALVTNLKDEDRPVGSSLLLYTAEQRIEAEIPIVRFRVDELTEPEVRDGYVVVTGPEFADPMKGWALVFVVGDRCTTQSIVTRCTYYLPFTTDEALQRAADSYGGLTGRE